MGDLRLGPFLLEEPLAAGGMAEVWSGKHEQQGIAVAIKLLKVRGGSAERLLSAFRREVRAVARLDHPHIVRIFDYGEIDEETATTSRGQVLAGCPYLVMERAFGGTLAQAQSKLGWRQVSLALRALLGALAHAHARSVLHRDIKPSNVLLVVGEDAGLRLADFGLTHPTSVLGDPELSGMGTLVEAGTPNYIAPETATGRWRDFGPWTDLYSLGAMAWELCTGQVPFQHSSAIETVAAHLYQPLPDFEPLIDCPSGFETWLRTLLAKRPEDRWRRASDASRALQALGEPAHTRRRRSNPGIRVSSEDTDTLQHIARGGSAALHETFFAPSLLEQGLPSADVTQTQAFPDQAVRAEVELSQELAASSVEASSAEGKSSERPPIPTTWRDPVRPLTSLRMLGAGLGLCALRDNRLVGRTDHRAALWSDLGRARTEGKVHLTLLEGSAGTGKSRLARWLCERAHELGAASVLKALHNPEGTGGDGLGAMLAHHYSVHQLDRGAALERLDAALHREGPAPQWDEAAAIAELIAPTGDRPADSADRRHQFRSNTERYAVASRLLQRLGTERTVVVWLDDIQWGLDSLGFARHLLREREKSPCAVHLLATVRSDLLIGLPEVRAEIDGLREHEATRSISIEPLPSPEARELIRGLLPLDSALEEQLIERAGGNPLFCVQMVRDWVQRNLLEEGRAGFEPREGIALDLPDDLHAVWSRRLDAVLEGQSTGGREDLERAALLGGEFLRADWLELGQSADRRPDEELIGRLLAQGLITSADGGRRYAFAHGLLRESILRHAHEAGRLGALHLQVASYLQGSDSQELLPKRAHHLLEGGQREEALEVLEGACRFLRSSGNRNDLKQLVQRWEDTLEQLGVPSDHRARVVFRLSALRERLQSDPAGCQALARALEEDVRRHGWTELLPATLECRLFDAMARADGEEVCSLADRVLGEATDRPVRVLAAADKAQALVWMGRLDEARALVRRAVTEARGGSQRDFRMLAPLSRLASALSAVGDLDEAVGVLNAASRLCTRFGAQLVQAELHNERGEILRMQGRRDEAREAYRKSLGIWAAVRSPVADAIQLNIAVLDLQTGLYEEAHEGFQLCLRSSDAFSSLIRTIALLGIAACAAEQGNEHEWDRRIEELGREEFLKSGKHEGDIGTVAHIAANRAAEAGWIRRARRAYELARSQFEGLDRTDEAEAVTAAVEATLPSG